MTERTPEEIEAARKLFAGPCEFVAGAMVKPRWARLSLSNMELILDGAATLLLSAARLI